MLSLEGVRDLEEVRRVLGEACQSRASAARLLESALLWADILTASDRARFLHPLVLAAGPDNALPVLCSLLREGEEGGGGGGGGGGVVVSGSGVVGGVSSLLEVCAVLLEQSSAYSLLSSDSAARLLCTMPDRCTNAAAPHRVAAPFFEPKTYYVWLARQATSVLSESDNATHASAVAARAVISRLCNLGQVAVHSLVVVWNGLEEGVVVKTVIPAILTAGRSEKIIPEMLSVFDTSKFFVVASALLEQDTAARHVLECGLLVGRRLPTKLARRLVSMHCMRGQESALALAQDLARIWSDAHFAKLGEEAIQLQVTRAIRYLVDSCGKEGARTVIPLVLGGVHERLGLTEGGRRRLAMSLAQHLSRNAEETSEPLDFGEPGLEQVLEWEIEVEEPIAAEEASLQEQQPVMQEKLDPDARVTKLEDDDDDNEDCDDDDSLSSYEIEDESAAASNGVTGVAGVKERRPVYLRDCLKYIQEGKRKAELMELGLSAAAALIRSHPVDLEDMCVPLTSALLHAANEFSIDEFAAKRAAAMVALIALVPAKVAEFVGVQFASPHWSIQQRIDMLDAAHEAVVELVGSFSEDRPSDQPSPLQIVVSAMDEKKTRRWGSALHTPKKGAGPNRFRVDLSGHFFWPFHSAFKPSFVSTLDFLVIAKLFLYLGKVISATPASNEKLRMLSALCESIWIHRWHRQEHVVRSCMIALTEAFLSIQPETVIETSAEMVTEAVNWLTEAARDGATRESSEVARACASELARHLQNVNKFMQDGGD